jgi:phosphoenolpyruvate carboxykinase (GTP)
MKEKLRKLFNGCMKGRTMYVLPFSMGPVGSPMSQIGVQLTDSPYVVVNMRIMARIGKKVFEKIDKSRSASCPACIRRRPAQEGAEGRAWPCNKEKYIVHFPETTRDLELRQRLRRQRPARQKVLRAAHRLRHGARRGLDGRAHAHPRRRRSEGQKTYVAAAFPSACGKTNFAMLIPPKAFAEKGWKVTVGDDIAWIKPDADGRLLHAINPEAGFFGVAPRHERQDESERHGLHAEEHDLHQRRAHRRRWRVVGRHDRHAARALHRLAGQGVDAGNRQGDRRQGRASQCPLHRAGQAVPHD